MHEKIKKRPALGSTSGTGRFFLLNFDKGKMKIEIKHYNEVSKDEFHDMIALRIEVFVIEQDCPYQELDGLDKDAYHLLLKMEHPQAEREEIIGTVRILKAGVNYAEVAIGRVVSSARHRGKGLGHRMMEAAMNFIKEEMGPQDIRLSAQSHLCPFYELHGFVATGKNYLEDGIPHSEMLFSTAHS